MNRKKKLLPNTEIKAISERPDSHPSERGVTDTEVPEGFQQKLGSGAAAMGVLLKYETLEKFSLFFVELARFNKRVNLVSRRHQDWIRTHFLDSLVPLALDLVPEKGSVLDLGAGAGFPGVPLKLARPGLCLDLAEASGKKCAWLRHLVRILDLEKTGVLEGRFEDLLVGGAAGVYDLVVTRAAGRPALMVQAARPFLRAGGRLLIFTRTGYAEKGIGTVHPYTIPGSTIPSVIWEIPF